MAEMLVRMVDKTGNTPEQDARLTKRGYVIVVQPDGWTWGTEELSNPTIWRVVSVPGEDPDALLHLLEEEPDTDPPKPVLKRRAFMLDVDAVVPGRLNEELPVFTIEEIDAITIPTT